MYAVSVAGAAPMEESSYAARTVQWSDGHNPGSSHADTQMVIQNGKASSQFLSVFDNLLPVEWCDRMYEYAVRLNRPWGAYVPTAEALDPALDIEALWAADPEKAMSFVVTRQLFFGKGRAFLEGDIANIHGTAVWCLASGTTNAVEYHIDYAELYRYETGIIQPPLYAGTCHVSPILPGEMTGGDFAVNMGGLEHYKVHGYKGKLSSADGVVEELKSSMAGGAGNWNTVKYAYNRGIMHDGDFPHMSTPIVDLPGDKRRVIIGLNCFPATVGECCQRAPEHSQAFNRTVKLYQTLAGLTGDTAPEVSKYGTNETGSEASSPAAVPVKKNKGFSLSEIKKNPALTKLLLTAAKKVKEVRAKEEAQRNAI